ASSSLIRRRSCAFVEAVRRSASAKKRRFSDSLLSSPVSMRSGTTWFALRRWRRASNLILLLVSAANEMLLRTAGFLFALIKTTIHRDTPLTTKSASSCRPTLRHVLVKPGDHARDDVFDVFRLGDAMALVRINHELRWHTQRL